MRFFKLISLLVCFTLLLAGCSGVVDVPSPNPSISAPTDENLAHTATTVPTNPESTAEPQDAETTTDSLSESFFEIHFIDVGQADASLVLCDGEAMLIDGGNSADSSLIYSYLKGHNISQLSCVIATHAHEDHCGGLSGALNAATVEKAYSPVTEYNSKAFQNFLKYLEQQDVPLTVPSPGDTFQLGSSTVTILGPVRPSDEPNNTSIVLKIVYGETAFLFTGDAELDEETDILDAGYDISCTVLKTGHHGSSTSTGYRWLREANPAYAVISCGAGNDYGHPHEAVLSRFRDAEVKVFRTDLQGDIVCRSDGNTVTFAVQKNPDADTLAGAGAGGNHTQEKDPDTEIPAKQPTMEGSDGVRYICNTNTKKFHYPDCSSAAQIADHNRLESNTSREELIAQGYEPCGRCKPSTTHV